MLIDGVPVLLISLEDQEVRRKKLVRRGLPKRWVQNTFPAVDLRGATEAQKAEVANLSALHRFYRRPLRASEVGCALSHREAARWLVGSRYSMALVLEDDVIPQSSQWLTQLSALSKALLHHASSGASFVFHLGVRCDQTDGAIVRQVVWSSKVVPEIIPKVFLHSDPGRNLWRAHAYLISRAAAERSTMKEQKILTLADDWGRRRNLGLFDELFFTEKAILGQDEEIESTIDPERARSILVMPSSKARDVFSRVARSIICRFRSSIARRMSNRPYRISASKGE